MAEYKIIMIDEGEPRKWPGPNGIVYYITVGLEGHDKPVSIGKKSPDALKVGDTVHGTIIPTDYLTDKWKGETPQASITPKANGAKWQPKDETSITLNMVWKNILNVVGVPENAADKAKFWGIVQEHTDELLAMGGKIKLSGSQSEVPTPSTQPIKSQLTTGAADLKSKTESWKTNPPSSEFTEEDVPDFGEENG